LSNLGKREKLLVIVGVIFVILYFYYNLFLQPISQKIKVVNESIDNKTIEYNSIEKLKVTNASNAKKLEAIKTKYDEAVRALPENERNPEIAYSLNTFATKDKTELISVAFGQNANYAVVPASTATTTTTTTTTTNHKLMFVPVTVAFRGDYTSTMSFISSVENDSRLAEVVNVSIIGLQSTIVLNYYSTEGTIKNKPSYDFKDNNAGKTDLFKWRFGFI